MKSCRKLLSVVLTVMLLASLGAGAMAAAIGVRRFLKETGTLETLAVAAGDAVYTAAQADLGLMDYAALLDLLRDCPNGKIVHGSKTLKTMGLSMENIREDTELLAYLLEPARSGYDPVPLAEAWCGVSYPDTPGGNAAAIQRLGEKLPSLVAEAGMERVYREIDLPLCPVLSEMEQAGIAVDREALKAFGAMLQARISDCESLIYQYAGGPFNINSPKQLGTLLFETLGLPHGKKTKTGWSTNIEVLESIRDRHPVVQAVIDYRMLTKLHSTYAEGLLKVIAPDGRIHTTFQNTVTATGRLSSTDPNLQNIPVRTELGGEFRKMFVAPEGMVLVDADYSQIELRVLAHISGDEAMREAFRSGEDFHTHTAAQVFGVPAEQVTAQMRRSAKAVNFGIVYGISAFSLAQDIDVRPAEAKEYMDEYLRRYSGVREYMKTIVEQAKRDGYVATLWGRRRELPELRSPNRNMRAFGERVALNMPIQGTAADIIKLAMIRVNNRLKSECPEAKLVLQVHDELIVECPEEEAEAVCGILREEMENVAALSVPLTVEVKAARTWAEAH